MAPYDERAGGVVRLALKPRDVARRANISFRTRRADVRTESDTHDTMHANTDAHFRYGRSVSPRAALEVEAAPRGGG